MDRLKVGRALDDWRWLMWLAVAMFVVALLFAKAIYQHRLFPGPSLELFGQPALVFFSLERSCPCQMTVVQNAEAQLANWSISATTGVNMIRIDFNRRVDLAKQFNVARAPALVLLNGAGQAVWKQDLGLSDEQPLNLPEAEMQIRTLLSQNNP